MLVWQNLKVSVGFLELQLHVYRVRDDEGLRVSRLFKMDSQVLWISGCLLSRIGEHCKGGTQSCKSDIRSFGMMTT